MTQEKKKFVQDYMEKLNNQLSVFDNIDAERIGQAENDLNELIIEVCNVFKKDLPHMGNAMSFKFGSAEKNINTILSILKLYLMDEDVKDSEQRSVDMGEKKIFISHRSSDKKIADILETFLTTCGITYEHIFCSSLPGNDIEKEISKEIKQSLKTSVLNIVILSAEFYQSSYCQNEAGIIWFLDVDKIIIALPEIDENLMEGFLDKEYKIRRLNVHNDILAICDIVRGKFPEFISSHAKLNANIEKLQAQYDSILKNRVLNLLPITEAPDNELNSKILSGEFSDGELLVLKYFYDTQNRFVTDDLLEIRAWFNNNNIENISIENAMELLVEDNLMEYATDIFSQPSQFVLKIKTYRELRKISKIALNAFEKCLNANIAQIVIEKKSVNEIDNLIIKGFTDVEILLIKYILDLDRENLYYGWQSSNETKMIENWEQVNNLSRSLSVKYSDVVLKLEIRKFIEPSAKTSYGNTKEYKIKDTFLKLIKELNSSSQARINEVIEKNKQEDFDDLPF